MPLPAYSRFALLVILAAAMPAYAACEAPFCSLNTDWGTQDTAHPGKAGLALQFGYAELNQLRHGRHPTTDDTAPELYTLDRRWTGVFDYDFSANWGMSLNVPFLVNDHAHVDAADPTAVDSWHTSTLGDTRVVARRRYAGGEHSGHGFEFGLKLPTGSYTETNSAGQALERNVQPGTGTTDAVLGAYYVLKNPDLGVTTFVHAQWQRALAARADYQPGSRLTLDAGIQRQTTDHIDSLVQIHGIIQGRDTGAAANNGDSGNETFYLSPGFNYHASAHYAFFGFFNQPLYRRYTGTQLTADWSVVVGLSYDFGGVSSEQSAAK